MSRTINTAAELDALPVGSVVLDRRGYAWQRLKNDMWQSGSYRFEADMLIERAPLTVLYDPSVLVPVVSDAAVEAGTRALAGMWGQRSPASARAVLNAALPFLGAAPSATREEVEAAIFEADDEYALEVHEVRSLASRLHARFTITPEDRPMSGVVTLLKKNLPGYNGKMNLYRLDPPLKYYDYTMDGETATAYVFVSAAHVAYIARDETYIFPADGPDATEPSDWLELPGSLNGVLSHEEALRAAGYEVDNA